MRNKGNEGEKSLYYASLQRYSSRYRSKKASCNEVKGVNKPDETDVMVIFDDFPLVVALLMLLLFLTIHLWLGVATVGWQARGVCEAGKCQPVGYARVDPVSMAVLSYPRKASKAYRKVGEVHW